MVIRLLVALLCCLLLAPSAYAFPDNGVLDTFTGCVDTTTPPNASWTNAVITDSTSSTVDCEDQGVTSTTAGIEGDMYWNAGPFGAAQEAYVTITDLTSYVAGSVHLRLVNIGASTTDGYTVAAVDSTNEVFIQRRDNGTPTQLGARFAQTLTAGDSVGGTAIGDQICAWYKVGAGAWTNIGCRTDATYSAGGHIGLSISGAGTLDNLDDFGGGNVAAAGIRRPIPPIFFQ